MIEINNQYEKNDIINKYDAKKFEFDATTMLLNPPTKKNNKETKHTSDTKRFSSSEYARDGKTFSDLYPGLSKILKDPDNYEENKNLSPLISGVYMNNLALNNFLQDAKCGKATGNIENTIKTINNSLTQIEKSNAYRDKGDNCQHYINFHKKESAILKQLINEKDDVIGNKKRGDDGIYR